MSESEFEYESGSLASTARKGNGSGLNASLNLPAGSMYSGSVASTSTVPSPSIQEQFNSLWNAKAIDGGGPVKTTAPGSDWAADATAIGGLGLGFLGYLQNSKLMNEQMKGMKQDRRAAKAYNQRQAAKTDSLNSALSNINVNPRQQTA